MNLKQLKIYARLNWLKVMLIGLGILVLTTTLIFTIIGLTAFNELESFYKKSMLASIPMSIFIYLFVGSISAGISTFIFVWFIYGGGMSNFGQKKVKTENVSIRWTDVIGMEGVKKEVWEAINLIKDRAQLKRVGGKLIKGIVMFGPPGCGKTYLAKAIATETGLPFLATTGSEFVVMWVGQGASHVRTLFKQARAQAEIYGGCIIFIDEIDSLATSRVSDTGYGGGGMSHNATVNQLLTEMDGLDSKKDLNIIVIGATNVNEGLLDPALMRPGRFDRKLHITRPGLNDRKQLFEFYLKKAECDDSINLDILARRALWFSPADIADMVREASLISVRNNHPKVTYKDLSEAYDRVMFGLRSGIVLSEREKIWTAYHESGHAIIAYLIHPTDDVVKASIIPRKGYLGMVYHRPAEEVYTANREYLMADIKISLASYAAEKIKFGTTASGVSGDFQNAYNIAHNMVWRWGMGESGIIGDLHSLEQRGWYGSSSQYISEKTMQTLDADVQKILDTCLKEAHDVLTKERELLEYFAQELLKKEELEYDEIVEIFKKHGKERPTI